MIQVPDGLADKASYKADKARSLCMHVHGIVRKTTCRSRNSNEASAGPIIDQAIPDAAMARERECFDDGEI